MRKGIALLISVMLLCGITAYADEWICPSCGFNASGNFCGNCGIPHTSDNWTCPQCNNNASGNFCSNCGLKKPDTNDASGEENAEQTEPAPVAADEAEELQEGGFIRFGRFEQDNDWKNGPEEIEWRVLEYDKENNRAFLLSRYGLMPMRYHRDIATVAWKGCVVRNWLHGEFMENAFTKEEQAAIITTTHDYDNDEKLLGRHLPIPDYVRVSKDQVFLLSYWEVLHYFNDSAVMGTDPGPDAAVTATAYAAAQGAGSEGDVPGTPVYWWIRTPDLLFRDQYAVGPSGDMFVAEVGSGNFVVRPALWLDLNSIESGSIQSAASVSASSPSGTTTTALTAISILLTGGEENEFSRELVLNAKTEFENPFKGYFLPAGSYRVTNKGTSPAQVTVFINEKQIVDGWEEFKTPEDKKPLLIQQNETIDLVLDEGEVVKVSEGDQVFFESIAVESLAPGEAPLTAQEEIEAVIRTRIENEYYGTDVNSITINENLGSSKPDDYIALVNLTWNVMNNGSMSKQMLKMYSDDLAATIATERPDVQEIAIFWTVPYLNNASAKCSYERKGSGNKEGMYEMDMMWDKAFN